ncbi:putative vacuolar membrane protein [Cyphellophora attinorum]|uniref:Putative vacuolar membrane protein n=1 Tax=Cyphellophora attinorum TaxID=1664694 RepID=A0A0N1H861_9EURO|nr:putative vacuolar membrane protein [Phialophora attinorum]KPI39437.1 putative vacuolar membrane protein [Phialophora attinorum]
MGCCGKRERFGDVHDEQKWDYVNLDDFKSRSCWTGFGYAYLIIMLIVSISIYVVDTFLAINLLAFNKWAGQIEPAIPFTISRWIFAGCIILSYILLIERWIRAVRVMKQGGVAKSYLDPLAVRIQSIRMGANGRGYRRFLVFAELTKSRKGADYVALFSYFSFEAAIRIIFAEGPRVVVNGITLYSVTKLNFIPTGEHAAPEGKSSVEQFFINIGAMADKDKLQATVLFGMLWTCLIWILAALSLAISVILYLLFLWHHIPGEAGGLKNYCRIKINKRMERVVRKKVDIALKKENEIRAREDAKAARAGGNGKVQPTLPVLGMDSEPTLPPLSRTTTTTTLPLYDSRPGTQRGSQDSFDQPPMPGMPTNGRPGFMSQQSDSSIASYSSNAPLISSASDMGYSDVGGPPMSGPFGRPGPPNRINTPRGMPPGPAYPLEPLGRPGTAMSNGPRRASDESLIYGPDRSQGTRTPSWDRPTDGPGARRGPPLGNPNFPPIFESHNNGRNSPGPGMMMDGGGPPPPRRFSPPNGQQPSLPQLPPSRGPTPGDRAFTSPNNGFGPPERSYTPLSGPPPLQHQQTFGQPPPRSYTPVGGPPLARVQTAEDVGGYRAFTPEPRGPSRGPPPPMGGYRSNGPGPGSGYAQRGPGSGGGGGGQGVGNILDHY